MDYSSVPPSTSVSMIADLPAHERPRERLVRQGPDALSDTELLAIILRSGRRGTSVIDLSRQLLTIFDGSLKRLSEASATELIRVPGIGAAKAIELQAAFSLSRRLAHRDMSGHPLLQAPRDAYHYLGPRFKNTKQEEFHALLVDTKHRLLKDEVITVGLVDRTQIHPREVFRTAIKECCSRIILAHNHPSGDPTPSKHDVDSTKQLVSAGKIVGIDVLDHVVIGAMTGRTGRPYVSFREENLL